ncbi:MAG: ISL3 family transposase [Phormidesmis sp. CAN_BIN36]|nr:ISL3 family transposase [Phormidesmis sp. CAN_BIN36]
MSFHLDYLLDLPGVSVETCSCIENQFALQVRIVADGINCPHCERFTKELHQNRPILVRDLSTFGKAVYLKVPRRQFYCRNCQRYATEVLPWMDWKRHHTKRYEEYVYQRIKVSTIEQVSREEGLGVEEIKGIFDHVSAQRKNTWDSVKRVGIDEIAMRKGHQDFVTVVGDIEQGTLLDVIDSHRSADIIEVLSHQPIELREQVEEVSIDMWGGFPKVIAQVFPNAVLVYDRFHVMKLVNNELNKLRKAVGMTLRGSRFLLLKNQTDLNQEQRSQLESILNHSCCLRIAHELKEELRQIYETARTPESGKSRFQTWLNHAQQLYQESCQTIRGHLDGICNYFISHSSSGAIEGINNRIKLIKRQGYGFTNFENFRARLLACFIH